VVVAPPPVVDPGAKTLETRPKMVVPAAASGKVAQKTDKRLTAHGIDRDALIPLYL
jgi:hypothetical protein